MGLRGRGMGWGGVSYSNLGQTPYYSHRGFMVGPGIVQRGSRQGMYLGGIVFRRGYLRGGGAGWLSSGIT